MCIDDGVERRLHVLGHHFSLLTQIIDLSDETLNAGREHGLSGCEFAGRYPREA
jgi:hypothetical protein